MLPRRNSLPREIASNLLVGMLAVIIVHFRFGPGLRVINLVGN